MFLPPNLPQADAPGTSADNPVIIHASCIALNGRAALIKGASGTGKSGLALELLAYGATLVSDDRTCLWQQDGAVLAEAPTTIRGKIEARFVGILNAATEAKPCPLSLIIDLDETETNRLPPRRNTFCIGHSIPLVRGVKDRHFAAAIIQTLKAGRCD